MLAASSLRNPDDDRETQMEGFEEFFDRIDSRDLFVGMDEVESLPDLEIVSDILTEFSIPSINVKGFSGKPEEKTEEREDSKRLDPSQTNENRVDSVEWNPEKDKKSNSKISTSTTTFQTKRKTKVDWTPELHRRFVQAVEQLGIDKAVPSRILELMGMDFLTRHNIASHLQKYRSHRKNMMARETAKSLTQRRHLCSRINGDMKPWIAPNVSLSPPALQDFRSFHAWGHPLPKHSFCPLPQSTMAMIPSPETFQWKVHAFAPGAFYFSQPRYSVAAAPETPSAQVILPHNSGNSAEVGSVKFEVKPITSKETIDATIGDVLKKPWLPLPLGLKPPSVESVLSELQRQGISHISLPSSTLS